MQRKTIFDLTDKDMERLQMLVDMVMTVPNMDKYRRNGKITLTEKEVMMKLIAGLEYGLSPMVALRSLYPEHGEWTLNVAPMMALVWESGELEDWNVVENTMDACTIKFRKKGQTEQTVRYTIGEAKSLGLLKNPLYDSIPEDMLYKQCASRICRRYFPHVTSGLYVEGELTFIEDDERDEQPAALPEPVPNILPPKTQNGSGENPAEGAAGNQSDGQTTSDSGDNKEFMLSRLAEILKIAEDGGKGRKWAAETLKSHGFDKEDAVDDAVFETMKATIKNALDPSFIQPDGEADEIELSDLDDIEGDSGTDDDDGGNDEVTEEEVVKAAGPTLSADEIKQLEELGKGDIAAIDELSQMDTVDSHANDDLDDLYVEDEEEFGVFES